MSSSATTPNNASRLLQGKKKKKSNKSAPTLPSTPTRVPLTTAQSSPLLDPGKSTLKFKLQFNEEGNQPHGGFKFSRKVVVSPKAQEVRHWEAYMEAVERTIQHIPLASTHYQQQALLDRQGVFPEDPCLLHDLGVHTSSVPVRATKMLEFMDRDGLECNPHIATLYRSNNGRKVHYAGDCNTQATAVFGYLQANRIPAVVVSMSMHVTVLAGPSLKKRGVLKELKAHLDQSVLDSKAWGLLDLSRWIKDSGHDDLCFVDAWFGKVFLASNKKLLKGLMTTLRGGPDSIPPDQKVENTYMAVERINGNGIEASGYWSD